MKFSSRNSRVFGALLACLVAAGAQAQVVLTTTLTDDQYNYGSVSDGGTREITPVFAFENDPESSTQFALDAHASMLLAKWSVDLPSGLNPGGIEVTSATLTVYNIREVSWDPDAGEPRLFAVGFLGGGTIADWNENTPYEGPGNFTPGDRNPFVRDLLTDENVQRDFDGTPWAVGVISPSYQGSTATSPEPFTITFSLDVSNPTIQAELIDHITGGETMWAIASTYLASFSGGPGGVVYPQLITKEGAANPSIGEPFMAPHLHLEVVETTSVHNWHLY